MTTAHTTDEQLITGLADNPDFITFNSAEEIEAHFSALAFIEQAAAAYHAQVESEEYKAKRLAQREANAARKAPRIAEAALWEAREAEAAKLLRENCPRCKGAGVIHQFHYVEAGLCFRCGGTGKR